MADALPTYYRGPGLRVRFHHVRGITAQGVLSEPLYLPAILGEFNVSEDFGHADYGTIGAGDFSSPQGGPPTARKLRTTDLDTLTIDWHAYARFLTNPQISPAAAQREILKLGRAKTPFELLAILPVRGVGEELRMLATLRNVTRALRPGEADTRYYTLSITEWRDNRTERRGHGSGQEGRNGSHLPTFHVLKAGDTLRSLSRHYYGTPNLWRAIAKGQIHGWGGDDPLVKSKTYKVGSKIIIPLKPDATRFFPMGQVNGRDPLVQTPVSRLPR